ncbi:MAG: PEF-CTERM sorting domain-containing protein [Methanophagales archaeon ANME-1-THS]|nr:MAG: PEF-CTERM sorting domain-containing protein [Methanophagales archaeon ANME-1-THS]
MWASYLTPAGETISVPIVIDLLTTKSVKVHFDAVGADSSGKAIAFVPPSEDVTQIPEFGTLAIPAAAIIGLLFFFNHRKHKNE